MHSFFCFFFLARFVSFLYHDRNDADDDDAVLWRRCWMLLLPFGPISISNFNHLFLALKFISYFYAIFWMVRCQLYIHQKIFNALLTWWFFISALYVKTTEAITQLERNRETEEGLKRKMRCTLKRNVGKYFSCPARKLTRKTKAKPPAWHQQSKTKNIYKKKLKKQTVKQVK